MISVLITGDKEIQLALSNIAGGISVQEILDDAGARILSGIRQRYLAKVDPDGHPWPPSQAGIDREKAGGPGTGFDTGRLFHSIQMFAITEDERIIATDVPYAGFFNFGTRFMPPRAFMEASEEDLSAVEFIVNAALDNIMQRTFLP